MALLVLLILLAVFTVASGVMLFLRRKLLHAVIFLAMCAVGSSLIFLYLGQVLIALLQILVFVGGLSTYLIVAVATEEKRQVKLISGLRFAVVAVVIALAMSLFIPTVSNPQPAGNDFSVLAQAAFPTYYAFFFAVVLLLFTAAIGSVLVIKKFMKMVL